MPMFSYNTPTQAAEFAVEAISNQSNSGSKLDLVRLQLRFMLSSHCCQPSRRPATMPEVVAVQIKIQSAEKQVVAGRDAPLKAAYPFACTQPVALCYGLGTGSMMHHRQRAPALHP